MSIPVYEMVSDLSFSSEKFGIPHLVIWWSSTCHLIKKYVPKRLFRKHCSECKKG